MVREKEIERYLVKAVKANGGRAFKWVSPGTRHVPDRILIFPGGVVHFVEVKAPATGKLSLGQKMMAEDLARLGVPVYIVDSRESVDGLIAEVLNGGV